MIQFYYNTAPNPTKVALCLAEMGLPYALNRYGFEARRHYGILDAHLAKQRYMLGDTYTIVDMNVWGWARIASFVVGEEAWSQFPNVKRLADEISARPAAARVQALKDRHKFKTELDAAAPATPKSRASATPREA